MTATDREQLDSLAVDQEVDALCDRFEAALRQGAAGALDDWLPLAGPARAAARIELARLEQEYRSRAVKPHPVAPAIPLKIGRYRVVKLLGQGSTGTVYQCHDSQLDRPVAVKVVCCGDDPALIERFHREARTAAGLTHPHLCPVYDIGTSDGRNYLTMPLLVGETLATYLHRAGPIPEKVAAQLTALLARALQEAHQAGVQHCALRPANVLLTERRQPIVMDCGLSWHRTPLDTCGLPYCAPELRAGDAEVRGPAADVYSLGVLLHEMLTGRLPAEGQESFAEMSSLHHVCRTALAQDPKRRYVSMEAFAEALEECADPPEPARTDRRLRLLCGAVALLSVVAAGALTLAAWCMVSQVVK